MDILQRPTMFDESAKRGARFLGCLIWAPNILHPKSESTQGKADQQRNNLDGPTHSVTKSCFDYCLLYSPSPGFFSICNTTSLHTQKLCYESFIYTFQHTQARASTAKTFRRASLTFSISELSCAEDTWTRDFADAPVRSTAGFNLGFWASVG